MRQQGARRGHSVVIVSKGNGGLAISLATCPLCKKWVVHMCLKAAVCRGLAIRVASAIWNFRQVM